MKIEHIIRDKKFYNHYVNMKNKKIYSKNNISFFDKKPESIIIINNNKKLNETLEKNRKRKSIKINIDYIIYIIILLFKILILLNSLNKANCYKFDFNYFQYSKISLKVKGEGYNTILGTDSNIDTNNNFNGMNFLIEIKINGKTEATKKKMYYFNELDNSVDLIWNDNIDNCDNMFYECENITEIDLSGFITTKVASMGRMFFSCISLTSINLSNFKTSKVTIMSFMFYNCSKLTSIDVSSFRTPKVTKTDRMFSYCLSLRSLDITHFDTSNVNDMKVMFNI